PIGTNRSFTARRSSDLVSDGTRSSRQTFTWAVANTKQAPVLVNPGAQTTSGVADYSQTVANDGPIAYWRLDEKSGSTFAYSRISAQPGQSRNNGSLIGG